MREQDLLFLTPCIPDSYGAHAELVVFATGQMLQAARGAGKVHDIPRKHFSKNSLQEKETGEGESLKLTAMKVSFTPIDEEL